VPAAACLLLPEPCPQTSLNLIADVLGQRHRRDPAPPHLHDEGELDHALAFEALCVRRLPRSLGSRPSVVGSVRFQSPNTSVTTKADAFERHTQILLVAEREDVAGRRQLANVNVACERVVADQGQTDCSNLMPELDGPSDVSGPSQMRV